MTASLSSTTAWIRGWVSLSTAALCTAASANIAAGDAAPAAVPALESLPALTVSSYMGTWYQVAYLPNVFQRQCVSDTTAGYRLLPDGTV